MWNKLSQPYYTDNNLGGRLKQAFIYGMFVFGFLWVFRPFGIGLIDKSIFWTSAGFGGVTFIAMIILNVLIPHFRRRFFNEESWTIGKEFFWSCVNVFVIGLANYLFFSLYLVDAFSWYRMLWFQGVTIGIAIFPITIHILLKENVERKKYQQEARIIQSRLGQEKDFLSESNSDPKSIHLKSDNLNEDLHVHPHNLLLLRSMDNYVEVYFRKEQDVKKETLRTTLKSLESMLNNYPEFFRCHKSYIINLNQVKNITGNAQGYKLHLKEPDTLIPVSRSLHDEVKRRLTIRP